MNLEYIVSKSAKPWHHKIFHQMMWRYLSAPLVWFFLKIRLKPNQITFISLMSKTISIIFYLLFWKIPAVIMYEFSILCDCADGAVARIRNLSSTKGKLFDGIGDTVAQHIFFMILPIALFLKYKNLNILIIGFVLYALVSTREIICAYGYIELKNKYSSKREGLKSRYGISSKIFAMAINFSRVAFPFIILFPLTIVEIFYMANVLIEFLRIVFYTHTIFSSIEEKIVCV